MTAAPAVLTQTATLVIPGPMPGLNELLAAARRTRGRWNAYAKTKQEWHGIVGALAARLPRFTGAVGLSFVWYERDQRRDPDNVAAAGRKLILDGLVGAGVLQGDGWRYVTGWSDAFMVDRARPRVEVTITGL